MEALEDWCNTTTSDRDLAQCQALVPNLQDFLACYPCDVSIVHSVPQLPGIGSTPRTLIPQLVPKVGWDAYTFSSLDLAALASRDVLHLAPNPN